jgi:hypothetical protein
MNKRPDHHPSAFISYAWDDESHKEWVKEFAVRLRSDGVNVTLDQWHLAPGDQLPAFMERAVRDSEFVIIVCTPRYKAKSETRSGGVGYEGDIITAEVATGQNHRKFIPILRLGEWESAAPSWLLGKVYIDLRGQPYPEPRYEDLIVTLHGAREEAPPVGPGPQLRRSVRSASLKVPLPTAGVSAGTSERGPISITRIVDEEVTAPRNDGTPGSALYAIPFQLSRTPSPIWQKAFLQTWDRPPRFTTMHRPGIARIVCDRIVLDGTTIDEVEQYHRETLLLAVQAANQIEAEIERERSATRRRQHEAGEEHRQKIRDAAQRIKFDAN